MHGMLLCPFAQFELLEVLLHFTFGVRRCGYAGWKILWLLYPDLVLHPSFLQLLSQIQELCLPLHFQDHLHAMNISQKAE